LLDERAALRELLLRLGSEILRRESGLRDDNSLRAPFRRAALQARKFPAVLFGQWRDHVVLAISSMQRRAASETLRWNRSPLARRRNFRLPASFTLNLCRQKGSSKFGPSQAPAVSLAASTVGIHTILANRRAAAQFDCHSD